MPVPAVALHGLYRANELTVDFILFYEYFISLLLSEFSSVHFCRCVHAFSHITHTHAVASSPIGSVRRVSLSVNRSRRRVPRCDADCRGRTFDGAVRRCRRSAAALGRLTARRVFVRSPTRRRGRRRRLLYYCLLLLLMMMIVECWQRSCVHVGVAAATDGRRLPCRRRTDAVTRRQIDLRRRRRSSIVVVFVALFDVGSFIIR